MLPSPSPLLLGLLSVGVCCLNRSLAPGVPGSDVRFKCGITVKDLKVGAQVVNGGRTATNNSVMDNYRLLEKSSFES